MTARVASGIPMLGDGMIMDIVAAVLIGGTSLGGGKGTMLGTALGSILVVMVTNSLNLLGIEWFIINIFKGIIILVLALVNVAQSRKASR
jgi:ribose transport system permease protein